MRSSFADRSSLTADFDAIRISLASPETIRSWSHGEVAKPETINYRTFKPERDGLFCAKIFGPVTDWECLCGKYKRMKHRGVICDKCGVEVTQAKVRRERLGHITLATPVSHVWFFKGLPSRIGHLLDISLRDLERILYFEAFVVIDPGDSEFEPHQLLTEEQYRKTLEEHGPKFRAQMGAAAIKELLKRADIHDLAEQLRVDMRRENSVQKKLKYAKRLKVVGAFQKSTNRPEWMILDVIPVIPPELRPLVPLDGGRFATSDLNDLYRRVINRNNRLKKLMELKAPDVIIRNEKRMLQEAVDALFDNGRRGRVLRGANNRPLKSLSDTLKGKQGRFRQNLLGKRVDYSGRSVIVVGPELQLHQCGLPKKMALELFKPFIYNKLEGRGLVSTIKQAKEMVDQQLPEVWDILEEVIREHPVLLNRAPTLHRLGIQAFEPVLVEGKAIRIHPLVCTAFNADFDGDQMAVHIPLAPEAQIEASVLMKASKNILSPANGAPITVPSQDIVLGCYYVTKVKGAWGCESLEPSRRLVGRVAVEDVADPASDDVIVQANQRISADLAERLRAAGCDRVKVRVRCESLEPSRRLVGRVAVEDVADPASDDVIVQANQRISADLVERLRAAGCDRVKVRAREFGSVAEVQLALVAGEIETLSPIRLRLTGALMDLAVARDDQDVLRSPVQNVDGKIIDTTAGRVVFNSALPDEIPFVNGVLKKKGLGQLVQYCYLKHGVAKTVEMLDRLKQLGFGYATRSGLSIGIDDLIVPAQKASMIKKANDEVIRVEQQYLEGAITNGERYNKVIAIWSDVTEKVADEMFGEMEGLDDGHGDFNAVYVMADSGARGSKQQIRQLAGMRGLMAKPSGEIIEVPITSNFREGLTVQQYFISTHGARKGLADTALKTADSGYLTRRLVDVAQDVIISEEDCGTPDGIESQAIVESGEIIEPLRDRIVGRVALEDVIDPLNSDVLVRGNALIVEELASKIEDAGVEKVKIRSVLTCAARRGVCARCYGRDLGTGELVELGLAVGVVAAQSIGEPGTQLTMRTFHIGGTASRVSAQSTLEAKHVGTARFEGIQWVKAQDGALVVMNRTGSLVVQDEHGRAPERYSVVYGAHLKVADGESVEPGKVLVEWDPYTFSIITETAGVVRFKDITEGLTAREEVDEATGLSRLIIMDSPDEKKQPAVEIVRGTPIRSEIEGAVRIGKKRISVVPDSADDRQADYPLPEGHWVTRRPNDRVHKGQLLALLPPEGASEVEVLRKYNMPSHAHLMVADGQEVTAGEVLAKIPRETTKTKDITGGLPRVQELFEARKPRETAVISEIDGTVKIGSIVKGMRKIIIVPDEPGAEPREYSLPRGVHVNVQDGDRVRAGEQLMDGPSNPHDILSVLGPKALQSYLVNEIQEVYRLQGVTINDKHIEVVARQMMRWVKIEDVGSTDFLIDEQVDRSRFLTENERVIAEGGQPATGRPLLLGITKASLSTDSFISAASFQETTRVLTEASISGKVDHLRGLKENVTMGRLIPAGTGYDFYRGVQIEADEPPPPPPPSLDELDLEREMEYLVEPETAGRDQAVE